jgi:tetratricopeptide (TPR) repeat protein
MGRHVEALAELQAVPPQQDPVVAFYTHMVRGDVERAMARYDAAQHSYQQALELFPSAQSARMALGHLARLRSNRDVALALLQPALTAPLPRTDDPWWDYFRGDGRNSEALFRRLRAPFLVTAPR